MMPYRNEKYTMVRLRNKHFIIYEPLWYTLHMMHVRCFLHTGTVIIQVISDAFTDFYYNNYEAHVILLENFITTTFFAAPTK